jgi:hypothetical protein
VFLPSTLFSPDGASRTSFRNVVILIVVFLVFGDGKIPKTHYFTTLYTLAKTF